MKKLVVILISVFMVITYELGYSNVLPQITSPEVNEVIQNQATTPVPFRIGGSYNLHFQLIELRVENKKVYKCTVYVEVEGKVITETATSDKSFEEACDHAYAAAKAQL